MPTRKQRRLRAKSFRHDYGLYDIDEEGQEVAVVRDEKPIEKKGDKKKASTKKTTGRGGKLLKEPEPPSWRRAFRRAVPMAAVMMAILIFLLRRSSIEVRIGWGLIYAVAFVPLTYYIDGRVYRQYQKRQNKK